MAQDPYLNFVPPPEAPVFEPTEEEFKDPIAYIAKIKPVAENYGTVKIKPPANWQPPFVLDPEKFEFTPRIQKLNELEAISRVRLNFINKIANFWFMQGTVLKVPLLDSKYVDLFKLHKTVQESGGYDSCIREKKWPLVAKKMAFKAAQGVLLKSHYDRLLKPYDMYESGRALQHATAPDSSTHNPAKPKRDYRRMSAGRDKKNQEANKTSPQSRITPREQRSRARMGSAARSRQTPKAKKATKTVDPMAHVLCKVCSSGDDEDRLLLCESCDQSFHTFCLLPPLTSVPKGAWSCPKCVTQEVVSKPEEAFGFEQSKRSYTLHTFGEMADDFKKNHFGIPCHHVPLEALEREYWRLVIDQDRTVSTMYGADLFSDEVGSGFPRLRDANLNHLDEAYAKSAWNLNNLPVTKNSFLSHISTDISGMMVPWIYVGMCFSTFCWHTEDHWSYSINYLHWGEPKRWYGVSGLDAEKFEDAMREGAPELFQNQPDLLHHIVTTMNPTVLSEKGVKIHSVTQEPGDFVITFPRSYHAGFNTGFNCAEAVNFCPADWLSIGRRCVSHYADMRRYCVFAHDELLCNIASVSKDLDVPMAVAAYKDMLRMIENERDARAEVKNKGVGDAKREIFELINDDERQCAHCKTTCFLSSVTCGCQPDRMSCLKHIEHLCDFCSPNKMCLRYRYTLTELPPLMKGLIERTKCFESWTSSVKLALDPATEAKPDLDELKRLLETAKCESFPVSESYDTLHAAVRHAQRCANIAEQLVAHKIRTRTRQHGLTNYGSKLRLEEVEAFSKQIDKLACVIPQKDAIKEFVCKAQEFKEEASEMLDECQVNLEPSSSVDRLRNLFDKAVAFDLQLPEVPKLKTQLEQCQWICAVEKVTKCDKGSPGKVAIERVRTLITEGLNFPGHSQIETAIARLQFLLNTAQDNEDKARALLQSPIKPTVAAAEYMVNNCVSVASVRQPTTEQLGAALQKTKDWIEKYDDVMSSGASLCSLEQLLSQSKSVPLDLENRPQRVQRATDALTELCHKLTAMFQKAPGYHTMSEILTPRTDLSSLLEGQKCPLTPSHNRQRSEEWDGLLDYESLSHMHESLVAAEEQEYVLLRRLRGENRGVRKNVCVCKKPMGDGSVLTCQLCMDCYHVSCLKWDPVLPSLQSLYVCPRCCRSLRPSLPDLEQVLTDWSSADWSLDPMEVALARNLVNKAKAWQVRAQNALETGDLSTCLDDLLTSGLALEVTVPELHALIETQCKEIPVSETQLSSLEQLKSRPPTVEEVESKPRQKRSAGVGGGTGNKKQRMVYHQQEQACSAGNCLRPFGEEVNWVQCESGCDQWYHILCVGLTVQQVKQIDFYTCHNCTTLIASS